MDLPEEYVQRMMSGIVIFEIPIGRLEGKFKLSQNRSPSEQRQIAEALTDVEDQGAQGIRAAMETHLRLLGSEGSFRG
jgi:transcriptional regulator